MGGRRDQQGYTVTYNSASHVSVLTQMYGSVWPDVLPWCILNLALTCLLSFLKNRNIIDLEISDKGHGFMGLFVAFLIVSRVSISLGRYNEARNHLDVMYRAVRELMANACVQSRDRLNDGAREWRNNLAYRACLLLRVAMAVIDYEDERGDRMLVWEIPEFTDEEKEEVKAHMYMDLGAKGSSRAWAHAHRGEREEGMRIPQLMSWKVRCAILDQRTKLDKKVETSHENVMLASVSNFMNGYMGMRKFLTTPFPFPLVQMARTFLFLYLFSLPFALLEDMPELIPRLVVTFIITYGFLGLETVSISLDNPFGIDSNDFDNLGMAYTAFEDIYLTILDVDGPEWVEKVRRKMEGKKVKQQLATEETPLVNGVMMA